MSRAGKNPVLIPQGVECSLQGSVLKVKGVKGELFLDLSPFVDVSIEDQKVFVRPSSLTKNARMMWGTTRRLVSNLVQGVSVGFTKKLEINGVGYRASTQGNVLNLQLGFSHDIEYSIPSDVQIVVDKPTSLSVSGASRQRVGQVAAEIRAYRGPEPYKGKGIRYADEFVVRKEGKKK